jgi:hypothetical protein
MVTGTWLKWLSDCEYHQIPDSAIVHHQDSMASDIEGSPLLRNPRLHITHITRSSPQGSAYWSCKYHVLHSHYIYLRSVTKCFSHPAKARNAKIRRNPLPLFASLIVSKSLRAGCEQEPLITKMKVLRNPHKAIATTKISPSATALPRSNFCNRKRS